MTTPNDDAEPSLASAGSQPVAWAVRQPDSYSVFASRMLAEKMQELCAGGEIVLLYSQPQPTLTDEERALLVRLGTDIREWDKYSSGRLWFVTVKDAAIIRGILERLG